MPEVEDGRLIRHRLPAQVNANKAAHRARFIQGFFRTRIRQVEPVLQEIDAQHPLQPDRRTAIADPGIIGLNLLAEFLPWNHLIHLQEKLFPASRFAKTFKISSGEGLLFQQDPSVVSNARIIADVRT